MKTYDETYDTWRSKLLGLTFDEFGNIDDWIYEADLDEDEFVDFVKDQAKELEKCIWEIDIQSLLIEFIAMKADVSELIPFLYNHGAETTFRLSPSDAGNIMAGVPAEDRNEAWFFIINLIEVELPDEELDG